MEPIKLRTLTPLWTGGVEGVCDRLHETAIIGSLRWWYEAIVRGLGGYVCDPTSDERCTYDNKQGLSSVCHVCQVFGCTGLARSFRIEVHGAHMIPLCFVTMLAGQRGRGRQPDNAWWLKRTFEKPGYSLDQLECLFSPRVANELQNVTLEFVMRRKMPVQFDLESQLHYLLSFISQHGALGRKSQNGFGQIQADTDKEKVQCGEANLQEFVKAKARKVRPRRAANTQDLFVIDFAVDNADPYLHFLLTSGERIGTWASDVCPSMFVPCAFDVRYATQVNGNITGLRWDLKQRDPVLARRLFGELSRTSLIAVSHPCRMPGIGDYHLRVFGFVSDSLLERSRLMSKQDLLTFVRETVTKIMPSASEM